MYFSDVGPQSGLFLRRHARGRVIDVMSSNRDRIGTAQPCGWDEEGAQFWKLVISGDILPGRFVVIDREFRPEE